MLNSEQSRLNSLTTVATAKAAESTYDPATRLYQQAADSALAWSQSFAGSRHKLAAACAAATALFTAAEELALIGVLTNGD